MKLQGQVNPVTIPPWISLFLEVLDGVFAISIFASIANAGPEPQKCERRLLPVVVDEHAVAAVECSFRLGLLKKIFLFFLHEYVDT
jgi:hypothetical protein